MSYPSFVENEEYFSLHEGLTEVELLRLFGKNLKAIHSLTTKHYTDFQSLMKDYLSAGLRVFEMEIGIISKVVGNDYIVCQAISPGDAIGPGAVFELQGTYCSEVVREGLALSLSNVGSMEDMKSHPVYVNMKLESYISAPIYTSGRLFGTLNFSSTKVRQFGFSVFEKELIEMMANSIGLFLSLQDEQANVEQSYREAALLNRLLSQSAEMNSREGLPYDRLVAALEAGMDDILSCGWLVRQGQGGLFLTAEKGLELLISRNLDEDIQSMCTRIETGDCVCGRALSAKSIQFSNSVGGKANHGEPRSRYSVPILQGDRVLGVFVLYLDQNHQQSDEEVTLLKSCSEVFASMILQYERDEANERLLQVFERSSDYIGQIDEAGKIVYMNPAYCQATGVQDWSELDVSSLHTEQQMNQYKEVIAPIVKENGVYDGELGIRDKTGREIPCSFTVVSHRSGPTGRSVSTGIFRDITKIKSYQEELEQFTYTVSHDLKAPLVSINGFASRLLKKSDNLTDEQKKNLNRILENTKSMQHLLTDLLSLSKTKRLDLELQSVEVQDLIESSKSTLAGLLESSKAAIEVRGAARIVCDKDRMQQVFNNLISNAAKYRHPERDPQIRIEITEYPRSFEIAVCDNGIGIPENLQDKAFGIFERINPGAVEGTGVGLAIVQSVIEKHKGEVWLDSVEGKGTTFYMTILKQF